VRKRLPTYRFYDWLIGIRQLPELPEFYQEGRPGEELATDEAAVWKRVLDFRVCKYLKPKRIIETHGGLGIGTAIFRSIDPETEIISCTNFKIDTVSLTGKFDLVDVDPFGAPWKALECVKNLYDQDSVVMVTNGEAFAVSRGLRKSQMYPSELKGKQLPQWVVHHYIPILEEITKLNMVFFYCFPTSVRVILSGNKEFPLALFKDCPKFMSWTKKYSSDIILSHHQERQ
jgi:hypothetical protein